VLVVNELYELSMNRLINIEFLSLFAILFLEGLNWINLNANIPNTSPLESDNTLQNNPILAYFIITFVTFTIALLMFSKICPIPSHPACCQDLVPSSPIRLRGLVQCL
jgi:polyferredoxin